MFDSNNPIKYCGTFLLSIFAVFVLVYISLLAINKLLFHKFEYPLIKKTIEEVTMETFNGNIDRYDTIIIGDSHPGQSFGPGIPPSWFKATRAGEDINLSLMKVVYFLRTSKKIKTIIMPLDYHSLGGSWGVSKEEYRIYDQNYLNTFFLSNKLLDDYNRKIVLNWLFSKLNKRLFKRTAVAAHIADGTEVIAPGSKPFLEQVEKRALGMIHPPIIDENSVQSLRRIQKLCKENNIQLIGVRFPLPNDYISYVNAHGLNKMDQWIDKNRSGFNYILDYKNRYSDKQYYFMNEDHLNINGMNAFTVMFMKENSGIVTPH